MARFPLQVALVAAMAVAAVTALTWSGDRTAVPPSAKALEAALLAPCCWNGTLATHDSPLAGELREEIEARSAKGETTLAIEADMVTRYGQQVLAMPSAGAFTNVLGLAIDALILAMGGLAIMLFRWRRAAKEDVTERSTTGRPTATPRDGYDDRIDAELAGLEGG